MGRTIFAAIFISSCLVVLFRITGRYNPIAALRNHKVFEENNYKCTQSKVLAEQAMQSAANVDLNRGKKVLVTGAAGFIGSHVVQACVKLGLDVVAVDDLSGGFRSNVPQHPHVRFVVGDLQNATFVSVLMEREKFEIVYHLAAYAAEGLSHFIRNYNYQNNLVASTNLITQSVRSGTVKRFVFTSSIAVYGAGRTPMTEDMIPMPEDPYGIAKAAVEQDLAAAQEMWGLSYTIFRPHNVYGPGQNMYDKYRNVVGIFLNKLQAGEALSIFGDGTQTRKFSYVSDVAWPIAIAGLMPQTASQIFNVGGDIATTVNELADVTKVAWGNPKAKIEHLDARNEVAHAESDHQKLNCFLPGLPRPVGLREGMLKTVKWAKKVGTYFEPTVFNAVEVRKNMPPSWDRPDLKEVPSVVHTIDDNNVEKTKARKEVAINNEDAVPNVVHKVHDNNVGKRKGRGDLAIKYDDHADAEIQRRFRQCPDSGKDAKMLKANHDAIANVLAIPRAPNKSKSDKFSVGCIVYTYNGSRQRVHDMLRLWLSKCDAVFIFSNEAWTEPASGVTTIKVPDGIAANNLWGKLSFGYQYLIDDVLCAPKKNTTAVGNMNCQHIDLFLVNGDDTYVVMENLRAFIENTFKSHANLIQTFVYMGDPNIHSSDPCRKMGGPTWCLDHPKCPKQNLKMGDAYAGCFNSGGGYLVNYNVLALLRKCGHPRFMKGNNSGGDWVTTLHNNVWHEDVISSKCLQMSSGKITSRMPDITLRDTEGRLLLVSSMQTPVKQQMIENSAFAEPSRNAFLFHYVSGIDLYRIHNRIHRYNSIVSPTCYASEMSKG